MIWSKFRRRIFFDTKRRQGQRTCSVNKPKSCYFFNYTTSFQYTLNSEKNSRPLIFKKWLLRISWIKMRKNGNQNFYSSRASLSSFAVIHDRSTKRSESLFVKAALSDWNYGGNVIGLILTCRTYVFRYHFEDSRAIWVPGVTKIFSFLLFVFSKR